MTPFWAISFSIIPFIFSVIAVSPKVFPDSLKMHLLIFSEYRIWTHRHCIQTVSGCTLLRLIIHLEVPEISCIYDLLTKAEKLKAENGSKTLLSVVPKG